MNIPRTLVVCAITTAAACAQADAGNPAPWISNPAGLSSLSLFSGASNSFAVGLPPSTSPRVALAGGDPISSIMPKIGIRIGAGNWDEFMLMGGVDVTFNVPFIPLPSIRVDGEVWGATSSFGQDIHGDALSLLGMEKFTLAYAGLGPSYYFTDNDGDHKSGFGVKLLAGLSLPGNLFIEAETILGPSTPPVFLCIGEHF